ncbi:MAG: tRNA (adenosine(37)-N6)-threonylcarbamoyltransferase complex ATPase subunit type 1 TsaE [Proteobacteria bacterium]|nr:tRNA (adenosine(37)-N6)-threonylcarbamoyltransferase complex ATPase subunit type 1 TsaE [Pseudomonadota bacterium]
MVRFEAALPDVAATAALAGQVAPLARRGDVVALSGALGSGKTTFARAFVAARAGRALEVPSPTFTLVQTYELSDCTIFHFDLYRLERADDAIELGIDEAFADGISLIEWPERLGGLLPAQRLDVRLTIDGAGRRALLVDANGWAERLASLVRLWHEH